MLCCAVLCCALEAGSDWVNGVNTPSLIEFIHSFESIVKMFVFGWFGSANIWAKDNLFGVVKRWPLRPTPVQHCSHTYSFCTNRVHTCPTHTSYASALISNTYLLPVLSHSSWIFRDWQHCQNQKSRTVSQLKLLTINLFRSHSTQHSLICIYSVGEDC